MALEENSINMKEFSICKVVYAHYKIESDLIYLRVYRTLNHASKIDNENTILSIIALIENKELKRVTMLPS